MSYPLPSGGYGRGGYGAGGVAPGVMPSLGYYLSLLASQYQGSPNLVAWLTSLLQPVIDVGMIAGLMSNACANVTSAIGPQLDVIGQIVGVGRTVAFQPSAGISPTLNDATYRILLQAKIAQNQWNGQIASLYSIWSSLFPGGTILIQDNQNMTASITLAGAFSSILQDLIINGYIVPRPEGVQYQFFFVTLPILGCDENNAYIAGADLGHSG